MRIIMTKGSVAPSNQITGLFRDLYSSYEEVCNIEWKLFWGEQYMCKINSMLKYYFSNSLNNIPSASDIIENFNIVRNSST
jgi:hypothetical protein